MRSSRPVKPRLADPGGLHRHLVNEIFLDGWDLPAPAEDGEADLARGLRGFEGLRGETSLFVLALWELNPYRGAFLVAGESKGTRARLDEMGPAFQAKREGFISSQPGLSGPLERLVWLASKKRRRIGATSLLTSRRGGDSHDTAARAGGIRQEFALGALLRFRWVLRQPGNSAAPSSQLCGGARTRLAESAKTFQKRRELHPGFQGVTIKLKPSRKSPSRKSPAGLKINSIIDS